ncbi:hypothetical protein A2U01_0118899, partial [Trifolium medium]|nr:hypothetical protein [Trifolium medium]
TGTQELVLGRLIRCDVSSCGNKPMILCKGETIVVEEFTFESEKLCLWHSEERACIGGGD